MPRGRGSILSHINYSVQFPDTVEASGVWTLREVHEYTAKQQWPALAPYPPSAPNATEGDSSVSLSWNNVWATPSVVDYGIQYSSDGGTTWATFADGVSPDTTAVVTGLTNGVGYIFRLFAVNALGASAFGSASSTVTPVAPPPPTRLLLHCDGSNNSTTFTDSSLAVGNVVTANGNAAISTAQSRFGGASAIFATEYDYLTVPSSVNFGLGTGDFTVEFWARLTSQTTNNAFFSLGTYQNGILFREAGGSNDPMYVAGTSYQWNSGRTAMTTGQWYHVAVTRESGVVRVFVGGVKKFEVTNTADLGSARSLHIGMAGHSAGTQYAGADTYKGYIDEFRIKGGEAVYTANFTPPSAPLSP